MFKLSKEEAIAKYGVYYTLTVPGPFAEYDPVVIEECLGAKPKGSHSYSFFFDTLEAAQQAIVHKEGLVDNRINEFTRVNRNHPQKTSEEAIADILLKIVSGANLRDHKQKLLPEKLRLPHDLSFGDTIFFIRK